MSDESKKETPQPDAALVNEADAALAAIEITPTPALPGNQPATDQATTVDIPTGKICGDLLDVTFNGLIAPKRGEHWKLTREESLALGDAYGAVIDKYFPDISGGPEVVALMLTAAMIGPRIAVDMASKSKPEKPSQASTQGDNVTPIKPGTPGEPFKTSTDE